VHRVDDPESAARLLRSHWAVHPGRGVLLANPIPVAEALPIELVERAMQAALQAAEAEHVGGKALTPFLLGRIATETGLRSVRANRALIVDKPIRGVKKASYYRCGFRSSGAAGAAGGTTWAERGRSA
jgi:pseudouridine-5'-phosphate glycosidase